MEWLRFEHTIQELYDVAVMPGVVQPEAISLRPDGGMGDAISVELPRSAEQQPEVEDAQGG